MKLQLTLKTAEKGACIPVNYPYYLSAAIYKILYSADKEYATFLCQQGYGQAESMKRFKLFTASDIKTPFKIVGDRLNLLSDEARVVVFFHLPTAAEKFIRGLFFHQRLEIADRHSRCVFKVADVRVLPVIALDVDDDPTALHELLLRPISPVVTGLKNLKGYYDFIAPGHEAFNSLILQNWQAKYTSLYGEELAGRAFKDAYVEAVILAAPPRSRLIAIKAGTREETKIRGFVNFHMKVKGTTDALELLINSGAGIYNSQCLGAVEVVNPVAV
ncbi:CRISPR-associated endoribonuclease Cas6 [Chitinophaga sp. 30R24]|uniref:CRISPR-associated endoribonuclease Cas6 n=1 Tax=Chitinophaga sp. 30R24 TaxID=3248838 RepID=UPI003B8F8CCC